MWEANLASPRGVFTVRRILNYVLATIVAAFLWVVFAAPLTHAATDANWNGASITYQNNSYAGPASSTTTDQLRLLSGIQAYSYVDPVPSGTGTSTATAVRDIHVIYFPPGSDLSTAAYAKYKTYTYLGPTSFTNPSNPIDISITPQNSSTSGTSTTGTSSCNVDGGLGWIICPVTNTLATGMDWVFKTLSGFLAVRPAETGQDTVLFRAWSYMRSFANIAFVIAFLIIIYSQLTNVGINNYSMKKLLPRLIVAAILVNLSYYISSIAIDISNILGYSLQDVFIQVRNSLVGTSGNSWDLISWKSMTGFILSSGTVGVAGGVALFTTLSTYGVAGSLFLLLPALVVALTAVLVALVVMAARQAIITLLVIIAPLAFVAYLLPNTEKWFDKWRSTFMTLLVLFPAFSLIFGGSQLAATAIIQNADSINLVILGMLVQVAPLFITPMLVKLSGSTVARIAGMVNNPNKGILDRTRNWSKDRADNVKAKRLGTEARPGAFLKRNAQRTDHNRRVRESRRKLHESMTDNRFAGSLDNARLHESQHEVETAKKTIEERLSRDLSLKIKIDPHMLEHEMKMRVVTDESASAKATLDAKYESLRAGIDPTIGNGVSGVLTELTDRSSLATRDLALHSIASQTAKRIQQKNLSEAMLSRDAAIDGIKLRDYAGATDIENGAASAVAFATRERREAAGKLVSDRDQLMSHFKLNSAQYQKYATGEESAVGTDSNGNTYTFEMNDAFARTAAIEHQMVAGSFEQKLKLIRMSGNELQDYADVISKAIPKNSLPASGAFFGGKFIDDVIKKDIRSYDDVVESTVNFITGGKIKDDVIAGNDGGAIKVFIDAANNGGRNLAPDKRALFNENLAALRESARIITDKNYANYSPELNSKASSETKRQLTRLLNNEVNAPGWQND